MSTLYEDPSRGAPLVISGYTIGMQMVPEKWTFSDPVALRHFLCLIILLQGVFYFILCSRQLRLIKNSAAPPPEMEGVMSSDEFKASKNKAAHSVELELFHVCADTVYSCLDLYLSTLAFIWKLTVDWYRFAPNVWLNVAFMTLFTTYLVIRMLPSLFYERMVLDPKYNVDSQQTWPLIGMICALALCVVFMQIAVIPITAILMLLAKLEIWLFVMVTWLVVVIVTFSIHLAGGIFGIPCLGKSRRLQSSEINKQLGLVLHNFKYTDRVFMVHTFHVGRPTAYVMGACCCRRLDIHDNLMLNRNIDAENLSSKQVGAGLNNEQMAAFVGHQLAHWRLWHVPQSLAFFYIILMTYLMIFGFSYKWETMYMAAGFTKIYPYVVGYWLVYKYLMVPYRTAVIWILYFLLRHFEYSADAYVYRRGFGVPLKAALMKLFADDRKFPYSDRAYLMWHHYHPPILLRIMNLQRLETLGAHVSHISLI